MITPSAVDALERRLPGRVGRPGSPIHSAGRRVFAVEGRSRTPAAVVAASGTEDAAAVMAWAAETGARVSVRSGGHAFDAFPVRDDGVLLDLSGIDHVRPLPDGTARIGPGARMRAVSLALAAEDRAIPGGDCPAVGVGGYLTGGGFGYLTRAFGVGCDSLVAATVVLPGGRVVTCSEEVEPDLLWACRGGAGVAGLVTDVVVRTHAVLTIATLGLRMDPDSLEDVLPLYAELLDEAPYSLDMKLKVRTTGPGRFIDTADERGPAGAEPGRLHVEIDGQFLGAAAELRDLVEPLLAHPAVAQAAVDEVRMADAVRRAVPLPFLLDPAPPTLRPLRVASDYLGALPDRAAARAVADFVRALQDEEGLSGGGVILEPCDGAAAAPAVGATAFAHRGARLMAEWELFGAPGAEEDQRRRHDELLGGLRTALAPVLTGGRYVNYPDALDTVEEFWGPNLPRLRDLARDVDPQRVVVTRLAP